MKMANQQNPESNQRARVNQDCVIYIMSEFVKGIDAARAFFQYDRSNPINITLGSEAEVPNYIHGSKGIIGFPFRFLHKYAGRDSDVRRLQQHKLNIGLPETGENMVSFSDWLIAAGIEETIHLLQDIGHPRLKAKLPGEGYMQLSKLDQILSEHETEARQFTDKILPTIGINPMWGQLDVYLQQTYPARYGKPAIPLVEEF